MSRINCPAPVSFILGILYGAGYVGYPVGGCVRDSLLGREPKDWDVATNATPEQMTELFEKKAGLTVVPSGIEFGTVQVKTGPQAEPIEVTTFRDDIEYPDGSRHPIVKFSNTIEEDLKRRDFTINAMAYDVWKDEIIDPFNGQEDLNTATIRTVGDPEDRFLEDALRMLRAFRFQARKYGLIHVDTYKAIMKLSDRLTRVSAERIQDELCKMLVCEKTIYVTLAQLVETGLMKHIIPELLEGKGMTQCYTHVYDVLTHNLRACQYVKPELHLRLAALLHDVGKPRVVTDDPKTGRHFYNHQFASAKLAKQILKRLRFSNDMIEKVSSLVVNHMFVYDEDSKPVVAKRLLNRVGLEAVYDLIEIRKADRSANSPDRHGTMGAHADRLIRTVEKILAEQQAFKMSDMAISGDRIMELLGLPPGKMVGQIKNALFEHVLEFPEDNTQECLEILTKQMAKKPID